MTGCVVATETIPQWERSRGFRGSFQRGIFLGSNQIRNLLCAFNCGVAGMLGYHGNDAIEDTANSAQISGLWNDVLLYIPEGHSRQQQRGPNQPHDGDLLNVSSSPSLFASAVSVSEASTFPSHLQKRSSLKELEGLLDGVVEPVVASSGQVGSDQSHGDHQPPAEGPQEKKKNKKHDFSCKKTPKNSSENVIFNLYSEDTLIKPKVHPRENAFPVWNF